MRTVRMLMAAAAATVLSVPLAAAPAYAGVTRTRAGSASDVTRASWSGPAFTMNGSGAVVTATMSRAVDAIRGGTGALDVVVLAGSGTGTPECDVVMTLPGVNSCTTDVLTRAADGDDPQVNTDIRRAEFVYFAGGDQCRYVAWKGTALAASVASVVAKGGGAGGGSAGLHVNSDIVYDACGGSATSATALADPYGPDMTFTYGLFRWPNYQDTINDSHFVTRDRMGRTLAFVARALQDGRTSGGRAWGVGIEQGGSLYLDRAGVGTLFGQNAYVVLGDHVPERARAGQSLTFSNFKIWKLTPGSSFDFAHRPSCGYYLRSVTAGVPSGDLYDGPVVTDCGGGGGATFTEAEPNDSRSAANDIGALAHPLTVTGSLGVSGDRDYFRESLAAGATLTVSCAVPDAYDGDLYLLGPTGSTLARSVNDGAGADESLTYTNGGSAGTVFAELEAYSGSGTAAYTCTVTRR
ncbi:hypothetical protein ACQP2F_13865 [Actinoplanes sp. CA-030573]|uniref:hypothetical protein n=1 Tax=Actinoplanes sp. CA-030573 TaxID=3239898 RepID=UPI003D91E160